MDSGPDELLGRALAELAKTNDELATARAELAHARDEATRSQRSGVEGAADLVAIRERVKALEVKQEHDREDIERLLAEQRARPGIEPEQRRRLESLVEGEEEEAAARAKAEADAEKRAAEERAENLRRAAERRARIWDVVKWLLAALTGYAGAKAGEWFGK